MARQPLPMIDPSALVSMPDSEVIGPRAVASLSEAFRSGFITADDVLKRAGTLGKTREKAELMALQEQTSPEAQQARSLARQAATTQNQTAVDTAGLAKQARETELQAAIWKAQAAPGDYELKLNALTRGGVNVPVSLEGGLTEEQRAKIDQEFADLSDFTQQQAMADQWIKGTEAKNLTLKHTDAAGNIVEEIKPGALLTGPDKQSLAPDKFKSIIQYRNTPYNLWKAQGKAKFTNLFGSPGVTPPPAAVIPTAVPATPPVPLTIEQTNQKRAQLVNQGLPANTWSDKQVSEYSAPVAAAPPAPVVTPKPTAVPTKPEITPVTAKPVVGEATPGGGIITEVKEAPIGGKPYHETQVRALSAVARAQSANKVFDDLDKKGFNPASKLSQLRMAAYKQGTLGKLAATYGQITPEERSYAAASENWLQGILRAESGAAISQREQAWYENNFFPGIDDPVSVQAFKAGNRKAMDKAMEAVVVGQMSPDEYESFRSSIGVVPPAGNDNAGAPSKIVDIPGLGKVQSLPNGKYRKVQ